jgi:hypothetical protein
MKYEIKDNIQRYGLDPFDDSLVYMYGFVVCLEFSIVCLNYHMEASGDASETKSKISCANGSREIINTS